LNPSQDPFFRPEEGCCRQSIKRCNFLQRFTDLPYKKLRTGKSLFSQLELTNCWKLSTSTANIIISERRLRKEQ
jgi:hypothetical protein